MKKLASGRTWPGYAIGVVAFGFVVVAVWLLGLSMNASTGRFSPRDHGPHGMAAVGVLWARLGHVVEIVEADDVVPPQGEVEEWPSGTLVFTDSTGMMRGQRTALKRWVEEGNTLVVLGRSEVGRTVRNDPWLGLVWGYVERGKEGLEGLPVELAHGLSDVRPRAPVRGVEIVADLPDSQSKSPAVDPLYLQRHAVVRQVGEGWIVAVADARTLSNRDIDRGDHAVMAAHVARYFPRERPVHMVDRTFRAGVDTALGDSLPVSPETFWQIVLFSGLILWRVGRRFGSPVSLTETSDRRLIEQVYSVANLYHRGRAYRRGLRAVHKAASDQVVRRLGGRGGGAVDWDRVERLYGNRPAGRSGEPPADALERAPGLGDTPITWAELEQRTQEVLGGARATTVEMLQLARQWEAVRRAAGGPVVLRRLRANEVEE